MSPARNVSTIAGSLGLGGLLGIMLPSRIALDKSPWRCPDERRSKRGAEARDCPSGNETKSRHRCHLAAGQRNELAVSADEVRAVVAPDRGDTRGPRMLDRRGSA